MNIVLGLYRQPHFDNTQRIEGNCSYPFTELIDDYWEGDVSIINTVMYASRHASKIIFLIDGLKPNITGEEDSYTCRELISILYDPFIPTSKIEFREDNIVVSYDYVVNKLNLN